MHADVIVLGAGASGLMCAMQAAARGRDVLVVDHGARAGRKVRIAGGGKCNVTNLDVTPSNYLCGNPHFVKSALARFGSRHMMDFLVDGGIRLEEREDGQIFTREGGGAVAGLLESQCRRLGARFLLGCPVHGVEMEAGRYVVRSESGALTCEKLVVALGGPAWPQAGATDLGHRIARSFGLKIIPARPGLVPLNMGSGPRWEFAELAGISRRVRISCGDAAFSADLLFTHGGISGPAALQISNYWTTGQKIVVDFLPGVDVDDLLGRGGRAKLKNALSAHMQDRLVMALLGEELAELRLADLSREKRQDAVRRISAHSLRPTRTAGWRKAEVTLGGVDVDALSSKSMEIKGAPGLHIVGEALDVTGWLGGYNLQWAWSSGYAAGQAV